MTKKTKPDRLELVAPWGGYDAGVQLDVLAAGEEPRPHAVDSQRAETLIAHKLAKRPRRVRAGEGGGETDSGADAAVEEF